MDEIRVRLRMGKVPADHALRALIVAKLFTRDRMRRLEFTADGLDRAKRKGWVKRTAADEIAQAADYIEHMMNDPVSAADLREGDHWDPVNVEGIARAKARKARARAHDAG